MTFRHKQSLKKFLERQRHYSNALEGNRRKHSLPNSLVGDKNRRFNVAYGVGKAGVDRLAKDMATGEATRPQYAFLIMSLREQLFLGSHRTLDNVALFGGPT